MKIPLNDSSTYSVLSHWTSTLLSHCGGIWLFFNGCFLGRYFITYVPLVTFFTLFLLSSNQNLCVLTTEDVCVPGHWTHWLHSIHTLYRCTWPLVVIFFFVQLLFVTLIIVLCINSTITVMRVTGPLFTYKFTIRWCWLDNASNARVCRHLLLWLSFEN